MILFITILTREEGQTLVICCEGNAGFYEIGMMGTPVAGTSSKLNAALKKTVMDNGKTLWQPDTVFLAGTTQDFLAPLAHPILIRQLHFPT